MGSAPPPPVRTESLMPDALVTGGTGFVGANVVRELLRQGATVRVLARPGGDRRTLAGLAVEICEGDLRDPASLRRAVAGVHTILDAAAEAGAKRIVYTSTVGALGIPKDGSPGTEDTPVSLTDMIGPYKASKFLAEQVALERARAGAPVVIVNPSAPVGPWDV